MFQNRKYLKFVGAEPMCVEDTCFGRQVVDIFFDDEGLEKLMAFVGDFGEAAGEMGMVGEEVLEDLFAVIIFAGPDEFSGKALS